jgi:hypothetical protein
MARGIVDVETFARLFGADASPARFHEVTVDAPHGRVTVAWRPAAPGHGTHTVPSPTIPPSARPWGTGDLLVTYAEKEGE